MSLAWIALGMQLVILVLSIALIVAIKRSSHREVVPVKDNGPKTDGLETSPV
jgi:hypothetical protein